MHHSLHLRITTNLLKMKLAILLLVVCVSSSWAQIGTKLTLETIDVDSMLKNEKLVRQHINCVLEKGRCDINGRDLKAFLPQALKGKCAGCSAKVKDNSEKIIQFMKRNHPAEWKQINAKYSA